MANNVLHGFGISDLVSDIPCFSYVDACVRECFFLLSNHPAWMVCIMVFNHMFSFFLCLNTNFYFFSFETRTLFFAEKYISFHLLSFYLFQRSLPITLSTLLNQMSLGEVTLSWLGKHQKRDKCLGNSLLSCCSCSFLNNYMETLSTFYS
jgi:hypothetical protein